MDKQDAEIISRLAKVSTEELERRLQMAFLSDSVSDYEVYVLSELLEQRKKGKDEEKDKAKAEEAWNNFVKRYPTKVAIKSDSHANEKMDSTDSAEPAEETMIAEDTAEPREETDEDNVGAFKKKGAVVRKKTVAMIACFCMIMALFSVPVVRGKQVNIKFLSDDFWFVDTAGGEATFDINASNDSNETEFDTIEEALAAYHITEPLVPTWIPEGYELHSVHVTKESSYVEFSTFYCYNGENLKIHIFAYDKVSSVESRTTKNDETPKIIRVNQIEHYLFSNNQNHTVTWNNKCYECYISGSVTPEELTDMVKSIYN